MTTLTDQQKIDLAKLDLLACDQSYFDSAAGMYPDANLQPFFDHHQRGQRLRFPVIFSFHSTPSLPDFASVQELAEALVE